MAEQTLAARIERLERQNRRLRLLLPAAALIPIMILLLGQAAAPPLIVRARLFQLVDREQRTRAILSVTAKGPSLTFYDTQGRPRLDLQEENGTPWIKFLDPNGVGQLTISADAKEGGALTIGAHRGKPCMLVWGKPGLSVLSATDENGTERIQLGYSDKAPFLTFSDARGRAYFQLPPSR